MRPEARESILGAAGDYPVRSYANPRRWPVARFRALPGGGFRWQDEPESRSPIGGGFTLRADGDPVSRARAPVGDRRLRPRDSPIGPESGRMYADANGSHPIPARQWDKMLETKIGNRQKTLEIQAFTRRVPAQAGIHRIQRTRRPGVPPATDRRPTVVHPCGRDARAPRTRRFQEAHCGPVHFPSVRDVASPAPRHGAEPHMMKPTPQEESDGR